MARNDDVGPCAAGEHCQEPDRPVLRGISKQTLLLGDDGKTYYLGRFHLDCEPVVQEDAPAERSDDA